MFNFFSTNPCGVKISDSVVEIMELSEDRVVETYGRKLLDKEAVEEGEILEEEKVVEPLRELLNKTGVSTERAVLTLPSSKISLERVNFEEELDQRQIKEEVEERVDEPSQVRDFTEIETEEGTSVLMVTAEKKDIEAYSEVVEKAGLEAVRIEPEQLALGRALLKSDGESRAIINLDLGATTLSIFGKNRQLQFFREIDFSGGELTRLIADEEGLSLNEAKQLKQKFGLNKTKRENRVAPIIEEELESFLEKVEEELDYYETNFGRIEQVILSGETALVPGLGDHVAKELGRMVQIGNPMLNLRDPSYLGEEKAIHPIVFASVIGLSLSEIEGYEGEIDLSTSLAPPTEEEEEEEEEEIERKEVVVKKSGSKFDWGKLIKGAGITLLVLAIGVAGYFFVSGFEGREPEATEEPKKEQQRGEETQQEEPAQQEEQEEPEPEPKVITVVNILDTPTGWLRVRGGPGTDYDKLDKVDPGQSFPLASKEGDWYEIELPYGNGWVYGEYAKVGTTTVSQ